MKIHVNEKLAVFINYIFLTKSTGLVHKLEIKIKHAVLASLWVEKLCTNT